MNTAELDLITECGKNGTRKVLHFKSGTVLYVTDEGTTLPAVRRVETIVVRNGEVFIECVNPRTGEPYRCTSEDFGETVFFTREEADVAMKEE